MKDVLTVDVAQDLPETRARGVHVERLPLAIVDGDGVCRHAAVLEVVSVPVSLALLERSGQRRGGGGGC